MCQDKSREQGAGSGEQGAGSREKKKQEQDMSSKQGAGRSSVQGARWKKTVHPSLSSTDLISCLDTLTWFSSYVYHGIHVFYEQRFEAYWGSDLQKAKGI